MADDKIKCPKCGSLIPLSEALTHQIRENLSAEIEKNMRQKLAGKLAEERAKAEEKAKKESQLKFKDLEKQIAEQAKMVAEAQESELKIRAKARELEARAKTLELEVTRKVDAEREKITLEARKKADDEHQLKDMEKDKVIQDLKRSVEEMKRKAEQGSMQLQGEVQEVSLEETLRTSFPADDIQPVPKGIKGADVVQRVMSNRGKHCGTIVWESKRTKSWSDGWIQKLKDDQRELGAEAAVIVSETMPKDVRDIGMMDGVWIARYELSVALAVALRQNLIEISFIRSSSVGKNEKMEAIYAYLTGTEFRQKIEAIVGTFARMKTSLDKERRAMQKIWKEREKQIERLETSTVGMCGEIREVTGAAALPEMRALELAAAAGEPDEVTENERNTLF